MNLRLLEELIAIPGRIYEAGAHCNLKKLKTPEAS
jgi:hypothetical protein